MSVIQSYAILSLYCIWPPPHGPKDSICILESRRRKEQKRERLRERERNAKGIHNISAYIQLAGTKVHGHTQLQGTLGNVVLVIAAMCPTRNPVTMKEWRNGYPGVSGSLCHNVYATLLNRITETVEYRLQALKMTAG